MTFKAFGITDLLESEEKRGKGIFEHMNMKVFFQKKKFLELSKLVQIKSICLWWGQVLRSRLSDLGHPQPVSECQSSLNHCTFLIQLQAHASGRQRMMAQRLSSCPHCGNLIGASASSLCLACHWLCETSADWTSGWKISISLTLSLYLLNKINILKKLLQFCFSHWHFIAKDNEFYYIY